MDGLDGLESRLVDGRDLGPFDREVVETVAALIGRVREAARIVADEGSIVNDKLGLPMEHPAVKVERMASAELRGWVKDRPDLFGVVEGSGKPAVRSGRDRFRAVAG